MYKDLEQQIINSVDELNLEDKVPSYQIWGFELDENQQVINFRLVDSFEDPVKAVAVADTLTVPDEVAADTGIAFYELTVETVLDFGDYDENVATLFNRVISIER